MTEEDKAQHDSEYKSLLALYITLLHSIHTDEAKEALYALSELRTEIAFDYLLDGLGIDYEEAVQLIKSGNDDNITQQDKDMRDRLSAGLINLINFSVCEEYQLYDDVVELMDEFELEFDDIDFDSDEYKMLIGLCETYNDKYSSVENGDIYYAGAIAAAWMRMGAKDWLVYWTQNDERVRPWHMALQGYAAPKDEFPEWMIPPIEWNCRCYLNTFEQGEAKADFHNIKGSAKEIKKPKQIDDVFSESLAKCGRIFGPSHSYFQVKEKDKGMLQGFVERLKEKYYGK